MTSREVAGNLYSGQWTSGDDLIDFKMGSLNPLPSNISEENSQGSSENLLDSEVSQLDEVLQTIGNKNDMNSITDSAMNNSVEVLISLDDEILATRANCIESITDDENNGGHNLETVPQKTIQRSNSELLLELLNNESACSVIPRSKSLDNVKFSNLLLGHFGEFVHLCVNNHLDCTNKQVSLLDSTVVIEKNSDKSDSDRESEDIPNKNHELNVDKNKCQINSECTLENDIYNVRNRCDETENIEQNAESNTEEREFNDLASLNLDITVNKRETEQNIEKDLKEISIEECLLELDNYLQEYDSTYSDNFIALDIGNNLKSCETEISQPNHVMKSCSDKYDTTGTSTHTDLLSNDPQVQQIREVPVSTLSYLESGSNQYKFILENEGGQGEQPYEKFGGGKLYQDRRYCDNNFLQSVDSGKLNLAFETDEANHPTDWNHLYESEYTTFKRNNPQRATVAFDARRNKNKFMRSNYARRSATEFRQHNNRCSQSMVCSDLDEIRRQELNYDDANRNDDVKMQELMVCCDASSAVSLEPGAAEVITGRPLHGIENEFTTTSIHECGPSDAHVVTTTIMTDTLASAQHDVVSAVSSSSSWLRSSMRRIKHIRLPSEPSLVRNCSVEAPNVGVVTSSTMDQRGTQMSNDANVLLTVNPTSIRPFSAPNRLSFTEPETNVNRSAIISSRIDSRSRSAQREDPRHRNGESGSGAYISSRRSRSASRRHRSINVARSSSESSRRSRTPRSLSSSEDSSVGSSIDSTPSCSPTNTPTRNASSLSEINHPSSHRRCEYPERRTNDSRPHRRETTENANITENDDLHSPIGQWPHGFSSLFSCLSCTLGLFNISRFAVLSIHFGANFIIQFFILSFVFGLPLFTLHLCLGQQLASGVMDMWRISPIFQGVGIALITTQALIGIYSIAGVSWMFVYFRDSFITKMDNYKWAEPYYRDEFDPVNGTYKLSETVPDYFNGHVLQRHHLTSQDSSLGSAVKFQVCFNLAVVWMIVFVSLSKGLRSYGKVAFVFTLTPVVGMFVLCAKLLGIAPSDSKHGMFPETSWQEFFLNTKCWVAAFQESFLTWGVFGVAVMQIASHNKNKHLLQRDSGLVIVITCSVLLLSAFLANTCVGILRHYGYNYLPGSFERIDTSTFMRSMKEPLPPSLAATPVRYMMHSSFIVGERVVRPGIDRSHESGYQALRLATELLPSTFALLGPDIVSPFWAVLFYFVMILFGIAQQLAVWHSVITGIMAVRIKTLKYFETSITFFSCACGFILGLPMTTEFGIFVVYFMDYCIGGAWWLAVLYLILVSAVFMVRGRPYSGETVVTALFSQTSHSCLQGWASPMLSFTWNVVLPVALVVLCVTSFKNGNYRELYAWHHAPKFEYWPLWARQLGTLLQLLPILTVPIAAFVQSYRYLNNGPPDILDRIQLLYRPPLDSEHMEDLSIHRSSNTISTTVNNSTATTPITAEMVFEDSPPKYTPPPSYTTATGARIAKIFRQSFRRSVRRIASVLGESSTGRNSASSENHRSRLQAPPPDYAAVLVEMNQRGINISDSPDGQPTVRNIYNSETNRSANNTLTNNRRLTAERTTQNSTTLTATDVANILRSSFRRSTIRAANSFRSSVLSNENSHGSLSVVCLVDGAAPIGQDSLNMEQLNNQNCVQRESEQIKIDINPL